MSCRSDLNCLSPVHHPAHRPSHHPELRSKRKARIGVGLAAALIALLAPSAAISAQRPAPNAAAAVTCDLGSFLTSPGLMASARGADDSATSPLLEFEWAGTGNDRVRMRFDVAEGQPIVRELAVRDGDGAWATLARDAAFEYHIIEGFRRISNQQLVPLRELGVELTQEVVDRYKWDVFWDAPLDLSEPGGGRFARNPPPTEGVAGQPGLPRSTDEIQRSSVAYALEACHVEREGRRASVTWRGLRLGSFTGNLVVSIHEGTSLIRVEAVAATTLPSVAYKYDVGLTGLVGGNGARVRWRDLAQNEQSYGLRGPANEDPVVLKASNRLVVGETTQGAIAAFPPPHTFFWAREIEQVVGNNWYRKDSDNAFTIGVRQGEEEIVEQYRANWSLYSAPPGTEQRMAAFFFPTLGNALEAFAGALAFTNGDVYSDLEGYKVLGSHYHTDVGRTLLDIGSVDARLPDFDALRAAGIDIAGPVDRPRDETQLEEQDWLFRGAERHSDAEFMVMPQMENSNLLGGHWDLLFSHPVYYVDERAPGTPLVTEHPDYGTVYNIGSEEDMRTMIEREDMLVFMPHPRTKGSTGYPDAIRETPQFLSDWYQGVGWRWGMGSDLSERRLSGKRVIPLMDDMNNWIADSDLALKTLLSITETYAKAPGDDIYANGPVTYLRLNALPAPGNYAPIVDALRSRDYFVTSGEVLIPSHAIEGTGGDAALVADVRWTFPLDFVEVVTGDGETTNTTVISAKELPAFGAHTFRVPFDATGQKWVRFAAWDLAGNGAMTMPVRLNRRD